MLVALDVARGGEAIAHEDGGIGDASLEQLGKGSVLGLMLVASVAPLGNNLRGK